MQGYLLDTNIVSYWFARNRPEHEAVNSRHAALPEATLLHISAISLGEVEYGHRVLGEQGDSEQEAALHEFIRARLPVVLPVDKHTRESYGSLRARLFNSRFSQTRKKRRPEQLVDPATGLSLGIQENDLWIAAQALQHNLVLVTHDSMKRLREVAPELRIEDWASA